MMYGRLGPTARLCIDKVVNDELYQYEDEVRSALQMQSIDQLEALTRSLTLDFMLHGLCLLRRMDVNDVSALQIYVTHHRSRRIEARSPRTQRQGRYVQIVGYDSFFQGNDRDVILSLPVDLLRLSLHARLNSQHFLLRPRNPFSALPTELLLIILSQLPIPALLTLSATSRNLRTLITEPAFLNQAIKGSVLEGSAFWILPVTTVAGEEERARRTGMEWLATVSADNSALVVESPFHFALYPYFPFVHACYESDSMRNRERLWKIVKQFDDLWRDYRLHGWQQDLSIHDW